MQQAEISAAKCYWKFTNRSLDIPTGASGTVNQKCMMGYLYFLLAMNHSQQHQLKRSIHSTKYIASGLVCLFCPSGLKHHVC